MSIPSWQQRIAVILSKFSSKNALIGVFLVLLLLPLTSACGLAQTPAKTADATPENMQKNTSEKQLRRERPLRGNQRQQYRDDSNDDVMQGRITYQGRVRTYLLHTPKNYDPSRPTPLVMVFHGGYGKGRIVERQSRFNDFADQKGIFVVYPDGIDGHWNDGRLDTDHPDVDDVGFIRVLIDELVKTKNVDSSRVYATGISNGGAFTHKLACDLSDKIAAFAPVASSLSERLASSCKPTKPVPILMFNSPDDPFVPWEGGEGKGRGGVKLSVPDTVEWWRKYNSCSPQAEKKSLPITSVSDGTRVSLARYTGGRGGAEVILYTIQGGGHTWPSGRAPRAERIVGRTSHQINANEIMWDFFGRHTLD